MFRWIIGGIAAVVVAVSAYFYFAQNPLTAMLNKRWPPITITQQQQTAIASTAASLPALSSPNIAAGVDVKTIQKIAFEATKSNGVTKLTVTSDNQLLHLKADFDIKLTAKDLPKNSQQKQLVTDLSPEVVGTLDAYVSASASLLPEDQSKLVLKLLPAVNRIQVSKIILKGNYKIPAAADLLQLLLNHYADNLNAALLKAPIMTTAIPAVDTKSFDPSGPIKISAKNLPGFKLSLASHTIKDPFRLEAAAFLIDKGEVIMIAKIGTETPKPAPTVTKKLSIKSIDGPFRKALKDGLGIEKIPDGVWAAIGKSLVAQAIDSAFSQAQPCLNGSGPIPSLQLHAKVPTPDGHGINCTPHRNCTLDTSNCHLNHDTRNCSVCLFKNYLTGGCTLRGNDPTCELEKKAQNLGYQTGYDACLTKDKLAQLDCERIKLQQKGFCEAEKSTLIGLHRTGNIANINGNVSGTATLHMCFKNVHVTNAIDKVTLAIDTSGGADLGTHFKFVPLDVVGHILCPAQWTADKNIKTSIPTQNLPVNLTIAHAGTPDAPVYQGTLAGLPLHLHFQPSPLSLVLQNANFYLACPATAGLINGLTLHLAPAIPEFLKDYTYHLKPVSFAFKPTLPSLSVMKHNFKPTLSETSLAMIGDAKP